MIVGNDGFSHTFYIVHLLFALSLVLMSDNNLRSIENYIGKFFVVDGGVIFMIASNLKPLSVILKPRCSTSLSANVHFVGLSLSPANLNPIRLHLYLVNDYRIHVIHVDQTLFPC